MELPIVAEAIIAQDERASACVLHAEQFRAALNVAAEREVQPGLPPVTGPAAPRTGCALAVFELNANGEATNHRIVVTSSQWHASMLVRYIKSARFKPGKAQTAAVLLNITFAGISEGPEAPNSD
jgi:hypothetical protein